jgi:hypothetical protein
MIIPPLALILGAVIGLIVRGHRRGVALIAFSAPVLALGAFAAQFVPGGAESCQSSTNGSTVCQSLPAISGWGGPLPYAIATCLVLLSLVPVVSLHMGGWRLAAVSAVLQSVPQVISFGGFLDWAPALLATTGVAFALVWHRPSRRSALEPIPPPPSAPPSISG